MLLIQCLLTITLLNGGHGFSESATQIKLHYAQFDTAKPPQLHWQLTWEDRVLVNEVAVLSETDLSIPITLPKVRIRTRLVWQYQLLEDGKVRQSGHEPIVVYPPSVFAQPIPRLVSMPITVISQSDTLAKLLTQAGMQVRTVPDIQSVGLVCPEYLLVDQSEIAPGLLAPVGQFDAWMQNGTQIVVFHLAHLQPFTKLPVQSLPTSSDMKISVQKDHMLLSQLSAKDLWQSLNPSGEVVVDNLMLDADQPVLDLLGYEPESTLAVKRVLAAVYCNGQGRILYWQLPHGDWQTDPRAQQLLLNTLDYLNTPLSHTPSRRNRLLAQQQNTPTKPQPVPTIGNHHSSHEVTP